MIKAIFAELLGVLGFSLLGAYIFWNARKEWLEQNYFMALWDVMLGIWLAGKLIWLSFV